MPQPPFPFDQSIGDTDNSARQNQPLFFISDNMSPKLTVMDTNLEKEIFPFKPAGPACPLLFWRRWLALPGKKAYSTVALNQLEKKEIRLLGDKLLEKNHLKTSVQLTRCYRFGSQSRAKRLNMLKAWGAFIKRCHTNVQDRSSLTSLSKTTSRSACFDQFCDLIRKRNHADRV